MSALDEVARNHPMYKALFLLEQGFGHRHSSDVREEYSRQAFLRIKKGYFSYLGTYIVFMQLVGFLYEPSSIYWTPLQPEIVPSFMLNPRISYIIELVCLSFHSTILFWQHQGSGYLRTITQSFLVIIFLSGISIGLCNMFSWMPRFYRFFRPFYIFIYWEHLQWWLVIFIKTAIRGFTLIFFLFGTSLSIFTILVFALYSKNAISHSKYLHKMIDNNELPSEFSTLTDSFLHLSVLSTGVTNPSVYAPIYQCNRFHGFIWMVIMFCLFIILKNIVLGIIFTKFHNLLTNKIQHRVKLSHELFDKAFFTISKHNKQQDKESSAYNSPTNQIPKTPTMTMSATATQDINNGNVSGSGNINDDGSGNGSGNSVQDEKTDQSIQSGDFDIPHITKTQFIWICHKLEEINDDTMTNQSLKILYYKSLWAIVDKNGDNRVDFTEWKQLTALWGINTYLAISHEPNVLEILTTYKIFNLPLSVFDMFFLFLDIFLAIIELTRTIYNNEKTNWVPKTIDVLCYIYIAEMFIRILSCGFYKYFTSVDIVDGIITVVTIIIWIDIDPQNTSADDALQILRIIPSSIVIGLQFESTAFYLKMIGHALSQIKLLFITLIMICITLAVIGMELFGYIHEYTTNIVLTNPNKYNYNIDTTYGKWEAGVDNIKSINWSTLGTALTHISVILFENDFHTFMFWYANGAQKLQIKSGLNLFLTPSMVLCFYCIIYIILLFVATNLFIAVFMVSLEDAEAYLTASQSHPKIQSNLQLEKQLTDKVNETSELNDHIIVTLCTRTYKHAGEEDGHEFDNIRYWVE